jgi:molybdopterin/thiamine biosynthesis adenylyltransferase
MTSLSEFYETSASKAIEAVSQEFTVDTCDEQDIDFPKGLRGNGARAVKVHCSIAGSDDAVILVFPKLFPDVLPKVYASKSLFESYYPIPHVDRNRFVCVRDEDVVHISDDFERLGEGAAFIVKQALAIITAGITGENTEEAKDELLAYWHDSDTLDILLVGPVPTDEKTLVVLELSKGGYGDIRLVAGGSEERIQQWFEAIGASLTIKQRYWALFLRIETVSCVPRCNRDIQKLLEKLPDAANSVANFFKSSEENRIIFFSTELGRETVFAGWRHTAWGQTEHIADGFSRLAKLPLNLRLGRSGSQKLTMVRIRRADTERLFRRVGVMPPQQVNNSRIAIVGCGAIGSQLAVSLARAGISKFVLCDPETLLLENVARHACSHAEARNAPKKVDALRSLILRYFPAAECTCIHQNVLDVLCENIEQFDDTALVVVCVANAAVERRLNAIQHSRPEMPPILYAWLEPRGVAGHMIFVSQRNAGCWDCCFSSEGEYIDQLVAHPSLFLKREAGCQSTFTPYASVEVESFVSWINRSVQDLLVSCPKENWRLSWVGDIRRQESAGMEMQGKWLLAESFSVHRKPILRIDDCRICSGVKK